MEFITRHRRLYFSMASRVCAISLLVLPLAVQFHSASASEKTSEPLTSPLFGLFESRRSSACDISTCRACASVCRPHRELVQEYERFEYMKRSIVKDGVYNQFLKCTKGRCSKIKYEHVCGLFNVDNTRNVLSQIREETDKLISEKNRLTKAALSYYGTIVKNSTMEEYSSRASALTRRCELLFENALRARAHYFDVVDYMGSVDYRIVKQEVTRLRFENEDLRRHLDFWQKQNGTLFLAAQTSPRGLEDARDALYRELKSYENDAVLMRLLKDTTLTKEERAQLIIKLKETLRSELQLLQDQRAHADKEAMFIETARREIFNLLRSVWKNIMADKLSVKCGTSALTDVVTDTFKSEFS